MKLLRRNEQSNNRGNISGAEIKHMKAISMIEELDERMKRQPTRGTIDKYCSEQRKVLDPKRLLCFSNKAKKDLNTEEYGEKSPWRSQSITDKKMNQNFSIMDERRKNGDMSALCNEICQDYYEIRKKLRDRPAVLTPKKTQILDAIAVSNSMTSSSVDAPLRNFDNGAKKREKTKVHYSNENRELHRRQRSLLDDNESVDGEKMKSKSNKPNNKKPDRNRLSSRKTNGIKSKSSGSRRSNKSDNIKSTSPTSNSRKSNRSRRDKEIQREMSMSEYSEDTIPISVVERKIHRNGIQPDISIISTMTSRSYSTCDESSIILSPRGAHEKVDKNSKPSRVKLGLVCSPTHCARRPQKLRHHISRNPSNVGISPLNLGTITEGDDTSSSSSSASFSSYGSSSSGSYSDYSDSGSDDEYDDPSLFYASARKSISKADGKRIKKKNVNTSCSTVGGDDIWNALMYDEATTGFANEDSFGDEEGRDDH